MNACEATGVEIKIIKEFDKDLDKHFTVAVVNMYPHVSRVRVERLSDLSEFLQKIVAVIPDLVFHKDVQF